MTSIWEEEPLLLDFWDWKSLIQFSKWIESVIKNNQKETSEITIKWKNNSLSLSYKPLDKENWELSISYKNTPKRKIKWKVNKKQMVLTIYSWIVNYHATWRLKWKIEFWKNENEKVRNSLSDFYSEKIEKYLWADWLLIKKWIIPRIFNPYNAPTSIQCKF